MTPLCRFAIRSTSYCRYFGFAELLMSYVSLYTLSLNFLLRFLTLQSARTQCICKPIPTMTYFVLLY
jgi:hypothetical protein